MRFSKALLFSGAVATACAAAVPQDVAAAVSEPVLPLETEILADTDVEEYPLMSFGEELGEDASVLEARGTKGRTCRVIPGDKKWPSSLSWNILKLFVGGRLVHPDPIASVCYAGAGYDAAKCELISTTWTDSSLHISHASSVMSALYTGNTCLPIDDPLLAKCKIGGYPVYVVNAETVWDVQAAVNFARNANIRLVIKNTGHDFNGKSSGSHSLSIRTQNMKDIKYISNYNKNGYRGKAFKVAAGVSGAELYAVAKTKNVVVVGGEGMTVGWGGGYIQGGGHSPLSSILGMAADSVLSFDVVLANGRYVTADKSQNKDLFWALRGGGGSTYGVVVATTVRAHADFPVAVSKFSFLPSTRDLAKYASGDMSNDDFWAVVKVYFEQFKAHADEGIYTYFGAYPLGDGSYLFNMLPFFAPKLTVADVNRLLKPVFDKAAELNMPITPDTRQFTNFYDAWQFGFPKETIGGWDGQFGSRLFPRENWEDKTKRDATFDVWRELANRPTGYMLGFNMAPKAVIGSESDTSFTPAWRNTLLHSITGVSWGREIRDTDPEFVRAEQKKFTEVDMKKWQDVSPNAGAYLGEADLNEPNRQFSFWGPYYARLYKIKQQLDPKGVFYAENAVASEDWTTGVSRLDRLCPL